jgi:hypothetical protein
MCITAVSTNNNSGFYLCDVLNYNRSLLQMPLLVSRLKCSVLVSFLCCVLNLHDLLRDMEYEVVCLLSD